jgi:hypothetical protein
MPSIRVVVVGIENPAQNDASGPRHARVQLTRYLHVLSITTCAGMWNHGFCHDYDMICDIHKSSLKSHT